MKYKPPKHKPRPIEDLLPHSKHILLTLLDGGIHINAVFRKLQQTGFSYKRDVLDAIKYLKKAELISKNQSPDNSTKVMIELTELGEKAVNMIASIERYTLSWSNLDKAVTQQFDIPHIREDISGTIKDRIHTEKTLRGLLKTRGWSEDEVNRLVYDKYEPSAGILHVLEQSPSVVINILLYKYQMFLEMNINEIGKKIIQRIIIDLISTVLECFQVTDLNKNNDINSIRDHNCKLVMDHTIPVMSHGGFMYQYVNEGVTQVLDSMFSIVDPRKEFIKRSINYRLESTNDIVASTIPDRDEAEFYFRQSILSAIPFYKKIVAKFT